MARKGAPPGVGDIDDGAVRDVMMQMPWRCFSLSQKKKSEKVMQLLVLEGCFCARCD